MKVLLRSDVRGLGRRGDIVEVKRGYARNFLLPSGAALAASAPRPRPRRRRCAGPATSSTRGAARPPRAQKALIERTPLTIEARAGANGRLFGSITEVRHRQRSSYRNGDLT